MTFVTDVVSRQSIVFAEILASLSDSPSQYSSVRHSVDIWSGIYVVMAGVAFIFWTCQGFAFTYSTEKLTSRAKDLCFRSILRQDISFFDEQKHSTGALINLLTASTSDLKSLSGTIIGSVLTFLSTILTGIIVSVAIGWKLALVCTATIPLVAACGWIRLQMLAVFDEKVRQSGQAAASYASEAVSAIRTVAALGLEANIIEQYSSILAEQASKSLRVILSASALFAASQSATFLCAALAFWYGGNLLADREYTLFQFYICFVALISGSQIAGSIFSYAPDASKAMHASRELQSIYLCQPIIGSRKAGEDSPSKEKSSARIEIANVTFRYPSRRDQVVLYDISLKIQPGQFVALVGSSGCGKSTIISLLERFYDPEYGTILVDGRDITKLDVHAYRQCISLVSQEAVLYSGTIHENLVMGLEGDVAEEALIESCKQANIYDFICSLP